MTERAHILMKERGHILMTDNNTTSHYNQVSQPSFHSLHHTFDIHLAQAYGIEEAILIHHFQHWIQINMINGNNRHDGRTWTYQTIKSIADHFPYWNEDQIRAIIERLCKGKARRSEREEEEFEPVLIKGNYNKTKFDKTTWYAFKNEEMFTKGLKPKSTGPKPNGDGEKPKPIPDTKTTDTKPLSLSVVDDPGGSPPSQKIKFLGKEAKEQSIEESDVFAYAIRTKQNWRTEEISYAMNALSNCKAIIYDVWRFIEGTIRNLRITKKGEHVCKAKTTSNSKNKENGIKDKSSEIVTEAPVSPTSTFIPKNFREAFPDFPFGPKVLRTS